MGWFSPNWGKVNVIAGINDVRAIKNMINQSANESIHIIGGVKGYRIGNIALNYCLHNKLRVGLLTEGFDPRGVKGLIRKSLTILDHKIWGSDLQFLFAMGKNGVKWYTKCGFSFSKVFTHAYLTEKPYENLTSQSNLLSNDFGLVFLGQCIPRKGVDIVIRALKYLSKLHWHLTIIGDGPAKKTWQKLVMDLNMESQIKFLPAMPNNQALSLVAEKDCLILPSRFDGWGAVVNEALMRGVPVICSDACGASDLLQQKKCGNVFKSGSLENLVELLGEKITAGKKTNEISENIRQWSRCIEGDQVVIYTESLFSHLYNGGKLPIPPWYEAKYSNMLKIYER
jgi:glycosyltransferase involved in cell wall biosynthesis